MRRPYPATSTGRALSSLALAVSSLALAAVVAVDVAVAQETRGAGLERGVAVISPDTVRVGEEFVLGITAVSVDRLQFPAVLALPDELEQTGPPHSISDSAGVWKAVYPLVAWKTGRLELPVVRIPVVSATAERSLAVRPPVLEVVSILPSTDQALRLQPPRMPSQRWKIPWRWLLFLVLVAALAREAWRRVRSASQVAPGPEEVPVDPLVEARDALLALRARTVAGGARTDRFYDEIESVIRLYLVRTRDWPKQAPVRNALREGLAEGADRLDAVIRRALPARFGALEVLDDTLVSDVDVVLAWLDTEQAA